MKSRSPTKRAARPQRRKSESNQSPENPKPDGYVFGRPTEYDPKYCQQLIEFCARPQPFQAFAGQIGVSVDTLYEWCKKHPDFSEAKKMAKAKCLQSMIDLGMAGTVGNIKSFGNSTWIFMMKNMHGWSDNGPMDEDPTEVRARLKISLMNT